MNLNMMQQLSKYQKQQKSAQLGKEMSLIHSTLIN